MDGHFSRIVGALVAWLAFITMLSGRNRWCHLRFKFFDVNVEVLMLPLFHVFNPLSSPISSAGENLSLNSLAAAATGRKSVKWTTPNGLTLRDSSILLIRTRLSL